MSLDRTSMQVRPDIEKPELQAVAPTITIVSDVDGLMEILDEMHQEFQSLPLLDRLPLVL